MEPFSGRPRRRISRNSLGILRESLGIPRDSLRITRDSLWIPTDSLWIPKGFPGDFPGDFQKGLSLGALGRPPCPAALRQPRDQPRTVTTWAPMRIPKDCLGIPRGCLGIPKDFLGFLRGS